jgi:hypothetical protein
MTDEGPTDAQYWLAFCQMTVPGAPSLVECVFARGILEDAADYVDTIGFCGRRWRFHDKSSLIAHPGRDPVILGAAR